MPRASARPKLYPTVKILREGQGSRPEVRVVRDGGRLLVMKDYSVGNLTLRLLGLVLLRRERNAYERLAGVPGIPACVGQPSPYQFLLEYVDGEQASDAPLELLTPEFYQRLEGLVRTMHARGVVHGDLKRLDNILVSPQGEPSVIDFSAAFCQGSSPLGALVFPYIWDDDLRAIAKLKLRRTPDLLTAAEQAFLGQRTLVERWFRHAREYLRHPIQRLAGSELKAPPPRP